MNETRDKFIHIGISCVFVLYLFVVVKILLFKFGWIRFDLLFSTVSGGFDRSDSIGERLMRRGNLIPFHEIRNYVHYLWVGGNTHSTINFLGNVAAFLPFGFLLPFLHRTRYCTLWKVALLSFLFSLCLEVVQLFGNIGTFDVDDLLLNTTGGILGYGGFKLYRQHKKAGKLERQV